MKHLKKIIFVVLPLAIWVTMIFYHGIILKPFSDLMMNISAPFVLSFVLHTIVQLLIISSLTVTAVKKLLSATQNAKSGKRRDKPKLSGINQHKADCYAVCCVSQVVYPARFSKVSCQKNRCVFASIFLYLLKRRSILNNRFKLF